MSFLKTFRRRTFPPSVDVFDQHMETTRRQIEHLAGQHYVVDRDLQFELTRYREGLLRDPRHADPLRLTHHGHKVYSQSDEDGIIAEIFHRIGDDSKTFVEFGVGDGKECNTLWLLMQGWEGLWLQASDRDCVVANETHRHYVEGGKLKIENAFVTCENINDLLRENSGLRDIDFLSIDVDFNDYWIWEAIDAVAPRVVAVEYNATWMPPAEIVVPYAAQAVWQGTNYYGASLSALAALGDRKGYSLVGCCLAGVNAFFVKKTLFEDGVFIAPGDAQEHYEPARFFLGQLASGHPPHVGPLLHLSSG